MCIYVYILMCVYIYIYIYIERERDNHNDNVYIYIYTYIHTYTHTYVWLKRRHPSPREGRPSWWAAMAAQGEEKEANQELYIISFIFHTWIGSICLFRY